MAAFATGRARTLKWDGAISCVDAGGVISTSGGLPNGGYAKHALPHLQATATELIVPGGGGNEAGVEFQVTSVTSGLSGGNLSVTVVGFATAFTPYGSTTTPFSVTVTVPAPGTATNLIDLSGTWSVECDVEEYCEALAMDASQTTTLWGEEFPDEGGTAYADGYAGERVNFSERLKVGGTVKATITVGAYTATQTDTIPAGSATAGYDFAVYQEDSVLARRQIITHTWSTTVEFQDDPLALPSAYSETQGSNAFSASGGTCSITAYKDDTGGTVLSQCDCSGYQTVRPADEAALRGRYLWWDATGTDGLTLTFKPHAGSSATVTASGGVWTYDGVMYKYSAGCTLNGTTKTPVSVDQTSSRWWRAYLDTASLSGFGEDPRDWRVQFRGKEYDSFSLLHAASEVWEDGSSASDWAAAAHTTVSATGGAIRFVVAGGAGGGTWTPAATKDAEAYRYLRFRIKAVGANKPFTVTIGSKVWNLVAGAAGTYTSVDLDLCRPHNSTSTTDGKTSRYALTGYGGDPVDTEMWGVSKVSSVVLSDLESGETYDLDYLQLQRTTWGRASFVSSFYNWAEAWESPTDHTYFKPFFWSDVDGRIVDFPDMFHVAPKSGTGDYLVFETLTQLIAGINGYTGWTATAAGSFPDSLHDNSRPAIWAFGNGAKVAHSSGAWTEGLDVDCTGSQTIQAQALWDQVRAYPMCGNVWDGGSYPASGSSFADRALPLRFTNRVRAHAWGLAFKTDDLPLASKTVNLLRSSDNANRGSDTTDTIGDYRTGSPYGQGNVAHRAQLAYGASPYVNLTAANRMRHRACFAAVSTAGSAPSLWIDGGMVHFRAYLKGGTIWVGRADNAFTGGYNDHDTGIAADSVCIRGQVRDESRTLHLAYQAGGNVLLRTSTDAGETWSVSTTVAAGKTPAIEIGTNGVRYLYWYDGGNIKGANYDRAGNTLATFTAVTGVDDAGVAVQEFVQGNGIHHIEMLVVVGGNVTSYTSHDGRTFS